MLAKTSNSAITKPNLYESQRIRLTSPMLHIGSEVQQLNPFEYVQTPSRVYLPNNDALGKALYQRGRLNEYISAIENNQKIQPLLEATFGKDWQDAQDPTGAAIFPETRISSNWTRDDITNLRPMIRNGMGHLYIPGSSIKGAIRTAIAYYLLKQQEERVSDIELKLREKLGSGELKRKAKFIDDELFMDDLFNNFSLSYQGKPVKAKQGPNTDFMRAIEVTDAQPLLEKTLTNKQSKKKKTFNLPVVVEAIVSSHFEGGRAKYRASIYAEMVYNARTEFTITLDREMLSWFSHNKGMQIPFQTIDDILEICQNFAQEQWNIEHDYWKVDVSNNPNAAGRNLNFDEIRQFYEKDPCPYNLRLGWGSGMMGTTVDSLLPLDLAAEIRDTCGIKAPNFEAPKSRRTIVDPKGQIKFVPGWIKFQCVKRQEVTSKI